MIMCNKMVPNLMVEDVNRTIGASDSSHSGTALLGPPEWRRHFGALLCVTARGQRVSQTMVRKQRTATDWQTFLGEEDAG